MTRVFQEMRLAQRVRDRMVTESPFAMLYRHNSPPASPFGRADSCSIPCTVPTLWVLRPCSYSNWLFVRQSAPPILIGTTSVPPIFLAVHMCQAFSPHSVSQLMHSTLKHIPLHSCLQFSMPHSYTNGSYHLDTLHSFSQQLYSDKMISNKTPFSHDAGMYVSIRMHNFFKSSSFSYFSNNKC